MFAGSHLINLVLYLDLMAHTQPIHIDDRMHARVRHVAHFKKMTLRATIEYCLAQSLPELEAQVDSVQEEYKQIAQERRRSYEEDQAEIRVKVAENLLALEEKVAMYKTGKKMSEEEKREWSEREYNRLTKGGR